MILTTLNSPFSTKADAQHQEKRMKLYALLLFLILLPSAALSQQKPVTYNNLSPGGHTPLDQSVHDALVSHVTRNVAKVDP